MVDPLFLLGVMAVVTPLTANQCLKNADLPVTECFQCSNLDDYGTPYANCPLDGDASDSAYSGDCQGKCFTCTDDQNTERVVRGCTETLDYRLPDPLPSDGCYLWDTTVWCVCSTPKCNGVALGKASEFEFAIAAEEECTIQSSKVRVLYKYSSAVSSRLSYAVVTASSCLFYVTYFKMTS